MPAVSITLPAAVNIGIITANCLAPLIESATISAESSAYLTDSVTIFLGISFAPRLILPMRVRRVLVSTISAPETATAPPLAILVTIALLISGIITLPEAPIVSAIVIPAPPSTGKITSAFPFASLITVFSPNVISLTVLALLAAFIAVPKRRIPLINATPSFVPLPNK